MSCIIVETPELCLDLLNALIIVVLDARVGRSVFAKACECSPLEAISLLHLFPRVGSSDQGLKLNNELNFLISLAA
jgi:hypothetical protein